MGPTGPKGEPGPCGDKGEQGIPGLSGVVESNLNIWQSEHINFTKTTLVSVTHNLVLIPEKCWGDVKAICKIANNGFSVNDYLTQFTCDMDAWEDVAPIPKIDAATISLIVGAKGLVGINKAGKDFIMSDTEWELIFRIFYLTDNGNLLLSN